MPKKISLLSMLLLAGVAWAGTGVTDQKIILGQSCALSGPAKALGVGMRSGLKACFDRANAAGGIHGRQIHLISRDDGYEPERAYANTRALIHDENVFLLIGAVGTPTAKRALPLAEEAGVPFFGPFTGAEFLRNPYREYVINIRGSYYQEMEALVRYLVDEQQIKRVACFYQNDAYGQAGLKGATLALQLRGMTPVATSHYRRNSRAVKTAALAIRRANPQAVIMVGAYEPCAEFIRVSKQLGMDETVFCNISFVSADALLRSLGEAGEGCVISQVVGCSMHCDRPLSHEYRSAMKTYQSHATLGSVTLEGYMVGKLFCQLAEAVGPELTREKLLSTLKDVGTFDLGGPVLRYGPFDHQGMDEVFLTKIHRGKIRPLEEIVLAKNR